MEVRGVVPWCPDTKAVLLQKGKAIDTEQYLFVSKEVCMGSRSSGKIILGLDNWDVEG